MDILKSKIDFLKHKILNIRHFLLFCLLLFVPVFLVFRSLFTPGPLAFGDAPFFYEEGLKELFNEPYVWTNRGENFGGTNQHLWLAPIMLFWGFLYKVFGLNNDLIIRILFYFPSLLLSIIGPILLAKYLKFSRVVQFFSGFFYVFNTYYLLLIDGGQIGIALAYGFFPITLLYLIKLIDEPNVNNFYISLLFLFLIFLADPRIGLILILTGFLFNPSRRLLILIPLLVCLITLSSYWLFPLLKEYPGSVGRESFGVNFVSLLYSLLIYSPHWPANEFGKIAPPLFYFVGIPILIFGSLFFLRTKRIYHLSLLFLVLAFLAKGQNSLVGQIYDFLILKIPFGVAFRDSSKFFIPLNLVAGFLIGNSIDYFSRKVTGKQILNYLWLGACYLYLLFLISPALLGKLNFVLSSHSVHKDYQKIYEKLRSQDGFFRTAWFPERHPLGLSLDEKPGLDAKELVKERPFAALNVGGDVFNFMMQNEKYLEYFDILGIKYLIFADDFRKVLPSKEEVRDRELLLKNISKVENLTKIDWGTNFQIYENKNTRPRIFSANKLFAVVGPELETPEIPLPLTAYFEDGKLNPKDLEGIASNSAILVFNSKDKIDFSMSFLQKFFLGPQKNSYSEWAVWEASDYQKWKFELLIRGIETQDFDYGKGVAFSSEGNESIKFNLRIEENGEYILAVRMLSTFDSEPLEISLDKTKNRFKPGRQGLFSWFISEPMNLNLGSHDLILKNPQGMQVINIVALIPKVDWDEAVTRVETFTKHFKVANEKDVLSLVKESFWEELDFEKTNPTRYKITIPKENYWVIFTDNYHPGWKLKRGIEYFNSLPAYSMVNAFYIESNWIDTWIVNIRQVDVRWGWYFSVISFLVLIIIFLWLRPENHQTSDTIS